MAVIFDPARGGTPYARGGGSGEVPATAARGMLDFGSVIRNRGLLDAQTSAAADPLSSATRFDEGSLFGHATAARPEPEKPCRGIEADKGDSPKAATVMGGGIRGQAVSPSSSRSAEIARRPGELVVDERVAGVRLGNAMPDMRAPNNSAVTIAGLGSRAMSGWKIGGDAGAGGASLAPRAHHRNMPGFVHVVAGKRVDGIELSVRAAGVSAAEADELERRLRETAAEEGASVKAMRLNGADRPNRAGRSRDG